MVFIRAGESLRGSNKAKHLSQNPSPAWDCNLDAVCAAKPQQNTVSDPS